MRRLYTVDQVLDLMSDSVDASVPAWRRRRAWKKYKRLPEAVHRQAAIVTETRFARAMRDVLESHEGEDVIEIIFESRRGFLGL